MIGQAIDRADGPLKVTGRARYTLDRREAGAPLSGVVVGDFSDCPDSYRMSVRDVLEERLAGLGVPVLSGLRVGHERYNEYVALGTFAELDASAGRLTLRP